ncbi:Coiled-coil domain-containing protein 75 [Aphelenchoides bicaudatus]|nr:Coiled-coil domain-containing protein 75 [Aphelenchoides bicaudatus]
MTGEFEKTNLGKSDENCWSTRRKIGINWIFSTMSDSEDDFMSDSFLKNIQDVKPGIAKNREQKRQLRIYANADAAVKQVPKHELEAQRRQEALNKPVSETNKGFSLLAKMGYKPGMTIGKDSQASTSTARLTEPIDLKLKLGRTGLGHDTMEKEKQQERCEAHLKKMQVQAKMSDILATDFRKRKRDNALQRQIIADIMKTRKACQEMDLRLGIERPPEQYLWPVKKVQDEGEEPATIDELPGKRLRLGETITWKYFYSNGIEAPAEEDLAELDETILYERLGNVTRYVRNTHCYCLWCGATYDTFEELVRECPGETREDHDYYIAMSEVKCLTVGDVNGQFKQLVEKVNLINKSSGPFDVMFCVGEFFGPNEEENKKLLDGDYSFPFDTYILGPRCLETAQYYHGLQDGDEICPNLTYLGKKGILFSAWGLSIGYLSGVESKTSNIFQFTNEDVDEIMLPIRSKPDFVGVDILLTTEWPKDVEKHSITQPSTVVSNSVSISRLAAGLKPRYHFSGGQSHFERTPYRNHRVLMEAAQHTTRFIGLAAVGNKEKEKWIYAFNIKPMKSLPRAELTKQPDVCSEFPYMDVLQQYIASQQQAEGSGQYFFDTKHYSDEEEEEHQGRKRRGRGGRDDGPVSKKHDQTISSDNCWFCLQNTNAERHLIINVGSKTYMASPKGPLTDYHVMILTIGHIRSMVEASQEVRQEIEQFKQAFELMCDKLNLVVVAFERNFKTSHLQLQLVPIPKEAAKGLKTALLNESDRSGLEFCFLKENEGIWDVVNEGLPYFTIELPDGSKLFTHGKAIMNMNLNFARDVLASPNILNCPKKADWRNAVLKKEREAELADKIKQSFKPFDFNADSDSD